MDIQEGCTRFSNTKQRSLWASQLESLVATSTFPSLHTSTGKVQVPVNLLLAVHLRSNSLHTM
jgi:hypothetical protein